MRFFCGRRGAATARVLITVWTFAGLGLGSVLTWAAHEAWLEFKGMREGIVAIGNHIARDEERWSSIREDMSDVKASARELADRVNGIDVRLARQEGRQ
jgi:hypothetical protein